MADDLGSEILQVAAFVGVMVAYAAYVILVSAIALVTSRLARAKGRASGWMWSAFMLGALGVLPLLVLAVLPSKTPRHPS
jgi:hypothetical protein